MNQNKGFWELMILDGKIDMQGTNCLAVVDIDVDGRQEIFIGGSGSLSWYRPDTFEKGIIDKGNFHDAIALEDVDGDGRPELFIGVGTSDGRNILARYKPGSHISAPWEKRDMDPDFTGCVRDLLFADIDGDGENELLVLSSCDGASGIYAYKRGASEGDNWAKYALHLGSHMTGLAVGDLDGDGRLEIINGPDWFRQPEKGPYSGLWQRNTYAPNFREMCRVAAVDITGNGHPDIVITDSDYIDGSLSWFENRLLEYPASPWVEHRLEDNLAYPQSLDVKHEQSTGQTLIFIAETEADGRDLPYNPDARLVTHFSADQGKTWSREILSQGEGTHQAIMADIDNDGELEIVGKTHSPMGKSPKLQVWKRRDEPALRFKHRFLDRDKQNIAVEIMTADVDGDKKSDVVCGSFWYKNPTWERFSIPGFYQVVNHYDIDGDGREEFIAMKRATEYPDDGYMGLMSGEIWWIKPVDPIQGQWEEHYIGKIHGDWIHGSVIAPLLPNGGLAFVACYHDSLVNGNPPEIYEIPADPTISPWPKRLFAALKYNEHLILSDIDNDGILEVVAGQYWFKRNEDGTFRTYPTDLNSTAARIGASDINGDGKPDIIVGQKDMGHPSRIVPFTELFWLENPEDSSNYPWKRHVIDSVRCALSISVADIDGDGEDEIIAGEHDPYSPYRSRCRLFAYKKANKAGAAWYRYTIDGRFEHHVGAIVFEIEPGRVGIVSHGWADKKYVHLWEVV